MAQRKQSISVNFDEVENIVSGETKPQETEQHDNAVTPDTSNVVTTDTKANAKPAPPTQPKRQMQGTNLKLDAAIWKKINIACAATGLNKQDIVGTALDIFIHKYYTTAEEGLSADGFKRVKEYIKTVE